MDGYIVVRKKTAKRIGVTIMCVGLAAVAACLCVSLFGRRVASAWVETSSRNELFVDGRAVAYFCCVDSDSTFSALSPYADSVHVASPTTWRKGDLRRVVALTVQKLSRRLSHLEDVEKEVSYYLGVHDVHDEGFEEVATCSANLQLAIAECSTMLNALGEVTPQTTVGVRRVTIRRSLDSYEPTPLFVDAFGTVWQSGRPFRGLRNGQGVVVTDTGGIVCGLWRGDSILSGRINDGEDFYSGQLDENFLPSGHGLSLSVANGYYEGHWVKGKRDGYGIAIGDRRFNAGEWRDGKFLGERVQYSSERIYGIDISRYQHQKGHKTYPLYWDKLRIRSLGSISRKTVRGAVDYPVSFVYIKSTEGTTVRNPYFKSDYVQARRRNVRVGAYHFFSVRSNAAAQANYFLRNTTFKSGDFPPVLDVEPTDKQIAKMGGAHALFSGVRTWMATVRRRLGVRPVLYVSQRFVNKYLSLAPDIKRDYKVWIARYGEYKPDVRLVFWQLSPDGGVNGIHGEVDISVFNGYRDKFDEFVEHETIR